LDLPQKAVKCWGRLRHTGKPPKKAPASHAQHSSGPLRTGGCWSVWGRSGIRLAGEIVVSIVAHAHTRTTNTQTHKHMHTYTHTTIHMICIALFVIGEKFARAWSCENSHQRAGVYLRWCVRLDQSWPSPG
jgi:hypothetical protein